MTTFVFSFSLGVYLFNNFGISEGSCATRIPAASKDSIFSFAEPELPEMIAPACPICFPGGADCPAINATTGLVTLLRYIQPLVLLRFLQSLQSGRSLLFPDHFGTSPAVDGNEDLQQDRPRCR